MTSRGNPAHRRARSAVRTPTPSRLKVRIVGPWMCVMAWTKAGGGVRRVGGCDVGAAARACGCITAACEKDVRVGEGEWPDAENARRVNSSREVCGTRERIHDQISQGPGAHEVSVVLVVIVRVRRRAMRGEEVEEIEEEEEWRGRGEKP